MKYFKLFFFIFLLLLLVIVVVRCQSKERIKKAYQNKELILQHLYINKDVKRGSPIFLRVFKQEKKIEVWALKNENFVLLNTYPICAASGVLGRKTKEGDRQVPEGIYKILIFNSKSDYHLSLGINYPNEADIFWADKQFPGNEIYIHGNCVSVGCLAVTNNLIEEIYLMAHEAHEAGQEEIPIHIFPFDMRKFDPNHLSPNYRHHIEFWKELKLIFDFFEQHQKLPHIRVNEYGQYTI